MGTTDFDHGIFKLSIGKTTSENAWLWAMESSAI